jgi:hypothetical protein
MISRLSRKRDRTIKLRVASWLFEKCGDLMLSVIEAEHIEKLFAKLIDTPAKANKWLDAMRYLFNYAIKRKLLLVNPAADIKRRKPKIHIGADGEAEEGHHTWTPAEVAKVREKFPVDSKMRLAIELINALAFRRSDVIRVGLPHTHAGHLEDGRAATFLKYTQHKNRETKPITVDVPIPAELLAVIKATTATGLKTWLIGSRGGCFSDQGLTDWFLAEVAKGRTARALHAPRPSQALPDRLGGVRAHHPRDHVGVRPSHDEGGRALHPLG